MHPRYIAILKKARPFLLTHPQNLEYYNLSPLGVPIPNEGLLSCLDSSLAVFYDLLQVLDHVCNGPIGMPMEKWVFFDCAEAPGIVFGFALNAGDLDEAARAAFRLDTDPRFAGYEGLVPISMYIAIPFPKPGRWFGHNLSSASRVMAADGQAPAFPGLGLLTKAMAMEVGGVKELIGATQWASKAVHLHAQLGDMEIMSAYTPAHSFAETMCYKLDITEHSQKRALGAAPKAKESGYDRLIGINDKDAMVALQHEIEAGALYYVCGRPFESEGGTVVPIRKG